MKRYCAVIELKEDFIDEYVSIHKNPWPEILHAISEAGAENLIIYKYKNLSILFYECEDLNQFYEKYGSMEITKKWNKAVAPWILESPTLDGSASVDTLEKIFDFKQQLEGNFSKF